MRTTVELPDHLYRAAKREAALRGCRLKDIVEEGLRLVLAASRKHQRSSLALLMKDAARIVNSGIPDLGSNPEHLGSFGRSRRRDR